MKRSCYLFLVVFFFLVAQSCDTASNTTPPDEYFFIKYYGSDGNQSGVDLVVVDDGIVLLGNSEVSGEKKIYLVKVDWKGKILWENTLAGPADVAIDMEPVGDGNLVILARTERSTEDHDVKLIIVSANGEALDEAEYGSDKKDSPASVTPLTDGGFIVAGGTQYDTADFNPADPSAFSNIFHFRCNANLDFDNTNWYELYGATDQFEVATKVFQESNNRFYVFGYSSQRHTGNDNGRLNLLYYLIGSGGTINSNPSFLGDFNQDTRSAFVMQVPPELGGGFFQTSTRNNTVGTVTLQVSRLRSPLKFNPTDDEQFDKELEAGTRPVEAVSAAACVTSPEGFLILSEETRNLGTKNLLLQKINLQGSLEWTVSLGSEEENDEAAAVKELSDGKIIVLGTVALGDNQSKMALFKLNSTGRLQE